ncbi:hypothetical protein ACFL2O_06075 [Thermodesulfobacteriota bacterium]
MKKTSLLILSFLLCFTLAGCASTQKKGDNVSPAPEKEKKASSKQRPPVVVDNSAKQTGEMEDKNGYRLRPLDIKIEEGRPYLPVGAEIITKEGKVPLNDVIKRLAEIKGFSISWADDVDQTQLVDVHIRPEDSFWGALDNVLRQLDYFYEVGEGTIVIRFKEVKRYYLSMPDVEESFSSKIGGDMLPKVEGAEAGIKAKVDMGAQSDAFTMWDGVQEALEQIVQCDDCPEPVIDRALGMITINAPKRIHSDVEGYLDSLRKEAYKQVIIEAKILEVNLRDTHREGIDWGNIFNQRQIDGSISFGQLNAGLIYTTRALHVGKLLRDITLNSPVNWNVVVSFFKQYGDTRIIANPKVSILNGHSAVLSAGQNRQYLESCDVTIEEIFRSLEAKINSVMEGLSIGIKANVLGDSEVILYVFPAITRIVQMRDIFESECGMIQAPETAVREMATFAKVRNNEVLVIGGLINKTDEEATEKVPYLGDLPLIGRLFKEELTDGSSSELVILIKPRILTMGGYMVEK